MRTEQSKSEDSIRNRGYVTKAYLCKAYKVSSKVMRLWLNQKYYKDLVKVGYEKMQQGLTPKQVEVLIDKVGEP